VLSDIAFVDSYLSPYIIRIVLFDSSYRNRYPSGRQTTSYNWR